MADDHEQEGPLVQTGGGGGAEIPPQNPLPENPLPTPPPINTGFLNRNVPPPNPPSQNVHVQSCSQVQWG